MFILKINLTNFIHLPLLSSVIPIIKGDAGIQRSLLSLGTGALKKKKKKKTLISAFSSRLGLTGSLPGTFSKFFLYLRAGTKLYTSVNQLSRKHFIAGGVSQLARATSILGLGE